MSRSVNRTDEERKIAQQMLREGLASSPDFEAKLKARCLSTPQLNQHEWRRRSSFTSCKKCGLVKGSGFAKCEPPYPSRKSDSSHESNKAE